MWKLAIQLPLSHISAHIDYKEALMSNLALEWVTRSEGAFGKRIVILGDNVAVVSAFTKGRSMTVARVKNSIVALDSHFVSISPISIMDVYNTILERKVPVAEMLRPDVVRAVCLGALGMRDVA